MSRSGSLTAFSSVPHSPLSWTAPTLQDTWRLPAVQLAREIVL